MSRFRRIERTALERISNTCKRMRLHLLSQNQRFGPSPIVEYFTFQPVYLQRLNYMQWYLPENHKKLSSS